MKELFSHKGFTYYDCLKDILIERSCEGILKTSNSYFRQWGYPSDKLKIKTITVKDGEAFIKIKIIGKKGLKAFKLKIQELKHLDH